MTDQQPAQSERRSFIRVGKVARVMIDRTGADDGRGCRAYRAGRDCGCCQPGLLSQVSEPYWVAFGRAAQMYASESAAERRRAETGHHVEGPFEGAQARELVRLYQRGRKN